MTEKTFLIVIKIDEDVEMPETDLELIELLKSKSYNYLKKWVI